MNRRPMPGGTGRYGRAGSPPGDRGSGVVLVLGLVGVVGVLAAGVATLGAAVTARHRAEAAADLAALAAASVDPLGWDDPARWSDPAGAGCDRAVEVAAADGALVVGCHVDPDGSVKVTVQVQVGGPLAAALGRFTATGRARAGQAP